jgi:hypothetical protein
MPEPLSISNPSTAVGSTPRAPIVDSWPPFGDGVPGGTFTPPCRTRMFRFESMPKSVVVVAPAILFV